MKCPGDSARREGHQITTFDHLRIARLAGCFVNQCMWLVVFLGFFLGKRIEDCFEHVPNCINWKNHGSIIDKSIMFEQYRYSKSTLDPKWPPPTWERSRFHHFHPQTLDPKVDQFFRSSPKSRTPDAQSALLVLLSNHPSLKRCCPMCFTLHLETVPKKRGMATTYNDGEKTKKWYKSCPVNQWRTMKILSGRRLTWTKNWWFATYGLSHTSQLNSILKIPEVCHMIPASQHHIQIEKELC